MAAVMILGLVVAPFVLFATTASQWLALDRSSQQALAYAKQGVGMVRQQAVLAAQKGMPPAAVTPPALASVAGVSYTESILGPASPPWQSGSLSLHEWTVTVSFTQPPGGAVHSVSLQVVVDPAVDQAQSASQTGG